MIHCKECRNTSFQLGKINVNQRSGQETYWRIWCEVLVREDAYFFFLFTQKFERNKKKTMHEVLFNFCLRVDEFSLGPACLTLYHGTTDRTMMCNWCLVRKNNGRLIHQLIKIASPEYIQFFSEIQVMRVKLLILFDKL